jgi:hypothetical protein
VVLRAELVVEPRDLHAQAGEQRTGSILGRGVKGADFVSQGLDGDAGTSRRTDRPVIGNQTIENLIDGKVKGRNGRFVEVNDKTPFYIYIVCDITPSLEKILKRREFDPTPDGKGFFKIKSKHYSAYFEVLPFEKVLADAQKRNRILFEKLNIE